MNVRRALFFAALLGAACACSPSAAQDNPEARETRLLAGETFAARLASIDARWNFTFDTGAERRVVGASDLITWGMAADSHGDPLIVLADGGLLAVDKIDRISSGEAAAWSPLFGEIRLPLESLRGIVLAPPSAALARDRLVRIIAGREGAEDRVLLDSGEELAGVLIDAPQDSPAIGLRLPAGDATLAIDKITALSLNPALVAGGSEQKTAAWIGLKGGSLLAVSRITPRIDSVEVLLAGGERLTAAPADFWNAILFAQPLSPAVTYLSDLPAAGHKQIPFLEMSSPPGFDANVLGGALRADGGVWPKGVGLGGDSRLAFDLPPGSRRFQAEAAVDDLAGAVSASDGLTPSGTEPARGSVVFRVLLQDRQGAWKAAFESPIVRSGDPPVSISVDVAGASRMALIVDSADRGQVRDYANWLNARLIR